ncbi:MAG: alpha/beta hydrolase [Ruminococcaceae bacterium]|nr:alpha/beta hydrolase [Oscillospiraceae bacterium]
MDILLIFLLLAVVAVLGTAFVCFRMAFYNPKPKPADPEFIDLPQGSIYKPYHDLMTQWTRETRQLPHEKMSIKTFDGLTLHAKYYEHTPGAPIELMFHGYRGTAERDLSGAVQRCFALGRSALIVDQRACSASEGRVITFGIREHRDCLRWVDFAVKRFGPDCKILLTGISMGATTVLMAAGKPLPPNVVGVLADCGFSSAKEIIQHVIRRMKLPPRLGYFFVRLGARLYGGFDPESYSALEAAPNIRVPVLFFHGLDDRFVPCCMSQQNYDACTAPKKLVTVPGAGHGLSYLLDTEGYFQAVREFFPE